MKEKIINLTPHSVDIVTSEGGLIKSFPPQFPTPRLSIITKEVGMIGAIPITKTVFGDVENLPPEKPNTYFIVSRMVLLACPQRSDLLVPNELVRDKEGRILGCKSLANE